jgi:hypothetical protein
MNFSVKKRLKKAEREKRLFKWKYLHGRYQLLGNLPYCPNKPKKIVCAKNWREAISYCQIIGYQHYQELALLISKVELVTKSSNKAKRSINPSQYDLLFNT